MGNLVTRHRNSRGEPDEFGIVAPDLASPLDGLGESELEAKQQELLEYMNALDAFISSVRTKLAAAKGRAHTSRVTPTRPGSPGRRARSTGRPSSRSNAGGGCRCSRLTRR